MPKLAAVITSFNRADFVATCIRSVQEAASADLDVEVIVMDNGSSDGSPEVARAAGANVRVEHTEDNRPLIGVLNRGLRIALDETDADYIIVMNEDTEFRPGALSMLVDLLTEHPTALIEPLQLNYRDPEHIDPTALKHAGLIPELVDDAVMGRPLKSVYSVQTIIGAGMIARRELWQNVGLYDELFWFYGTDDDYCNRARYLGHEILVAPNAHLLHAHGKLNAELRAENMADETRKWRLETQARYLLRLKNPDRSLAANYFFFVFFFYREFRRYTLRLWPRGMWLAFTIFCDCIGKAPALSRTMKEHFDPARKVNSAPKDEAEPVEAS